VGPGRNLLLTAILVLLTLQLNAQSPGQATAPDWQTAAGGEMAFDTVTVRANTTTPAFAMRSAFPLGPGDVYVPTGGVFRASNYPLIAYIEFAYKIADNQEPSLLAQLPRWAIDDRFDIQGNVQGNPSKDQMRLMMQSLLADRFHFGAHYETRRVPVLALLLEQPGRPGPLLQKHPDDYPCPTTPVAPSPAPNAPPQLLDSRFPTTCGGLLSMAPSRPGRARSGARNVPIELIAISMGEADGADRPVVDKTGLTGMFDFAIEFTPALEPGSPADANAHRDLTGPTFLEALRDQLGLRLEPQTSEISFLIITSIGEPPPN